MMKSRFLAIKCLTKGQKKAVMKEFGGIRVVIPKPETRHNPIKRQKRDEQICRKRLSGEMKEDISHTFNLSTRTIERILKQNGINIHETKKKSLVNEIKLLLKMGMNVTAIAKKIGKTRAWIHHIIKKEGLK